MSAVIDSKLYDLSKLVANQKVTTRNRTRRKISSYIAYQPNYYDDLQQNNNKILNSPFIENAAYFLKEHFIQITCFQTHRKTSASFKEHTYNLWLAFFL